MTNTAATCRYGGGLTAAAAAAAAVAAVAAAIRPQLPAERAEFFYLRAKRLYELGGQYSVVLERVVTTTLKVLNCTTCFVGNPNFRCLYRLIMHERTCDNNDLPSNLTALLKFVDDIIHRRQYLLQLRI